MLATLRCLNLLLSMKPPFLIIAPQNGAINTMCVMFLHVTVLKPKDWLLKTALWRGIEHILSFSILRCIEILANFVAKEGTVLRLNVGTVSLVLIILFLQIFSVILSFCINAGFFALGVGRTQICGLSAPGA